MAKAAGVSIASVSRELNGRGGVSAENSLKIQAAIKAIGYVPANAAQTLSRRRSRVLGALIPTLDYSVYARKVQSFRARAMMKGYSVLLATTDWEATSELAQCDDLVRGGAEGIMLEGNNHPPELYERLRQNNVLYVNTSVYNPEGPHPTIGFRNNTLASRATQHLIDLGHRSIAVIVSKLANNDRASDRLAGVRATIEAAGGSLPDSHVVQCDFRMSSSREALRHLMAQTPRPTAVVCTNDVLAMGAIMECQHSGIKVPQSLSVIGFDDLDWAAHLSPPLTTFLVPTAEIGARSADYLISRIDGVPVIDHAELDVPFIMRQSTGPVEREAPDTSPQSIAATVT
ncbi:LacI family DNA-binding transcriptional regulator [Agrobacterium larrymoorei]|uniref:Substrate-binding domain-containing protein n=1 Tax=Agrobacterium larrymoorei TaxID=160699 RepID=A0AAF0KEP8_9HYPH|nr:substrate-binding domain-containing protein [Agrobacterium larrymoorei]WHA42610.1 substrate-binding domain-containing protein [Agrobacterium larrymoorei]